MLAEELMSRRLIECVAFHEDASCAFDDGAAAEGAFEFVVLGEAARTSRTGDLGRRVRSARFKP